MAKCTKTPKLTTLQSTQAQATADMYIKQGLLLSAVKLMNSKNLPLTKKLLLSVRKYHPTSANLFLHLLHSNSVFHTDGLWANSVRTKLISLHRKYGRPTLVSGRKASKLLRSGKTNSRTKR